MSIPETIMSAIVAMASLSLPVLLGFLLHSTINIRKDLNAINSRLGRIEGRLFGVDPPSSG